METVAVVSREQIERRRCERGQELQRLGRAVLTSSARGYNDGWSEDRKQAVADLLVFLGLVHNIPQAKRDWIDGR